ncbi:MAG: hypothetical protein U5N56_04265 [Candidatus Marinimicrobia bacterium]|nr:hypothetical protein [Candidatus Neomarinimicrobiota bacterium]
MNIYKNYFPKYLSKPDAYPEVGEHMEKCPSCRTLFHIFQGFDDNRSVSLPHPKRELNRRKIYKKMHRHDIFVLARRISGAAAVFLIVLLSVFHFDNISSPSMADISDDVLYLESDANVIPPPDIDEEAMIEYLAQNESVEYLGELF